MSFTMSFRTGKDGEPVFGERPLFREEFLKKIYDGRLNVSAQLGEMFTDFISMEGNISNSNHPFIQAAGDTCEGITSDSYFLVQLKEYVDLGIENKSFFEESCFMFFLETQGLQLPAMHYTLVMKEGHEDKCVEDFIEENENMSPLERMMRGYMATKNEIYDIPLTTYECETVEDACIASLHFLITHNCNLLKCQNCGKYFISERSDAKYCDRMSPFNTNATCKIDGAQRTHRKHSNENDLDKKIRLKKKAQYQDYYRHRNSEKACKEYNIFQDTIKRMEKELKFGVITEDQFLEWLEQQ